MWRDKGWIKHRSVFFELHQPLKPYYKTRQIDYEAGADAMLGALKENSFYICKDNIKVAVKDVVAEKKGWLVFIPDEY